jgi:hypothetical protein
MVIQTWNSVARGYVEYITAQAVETHGYQSGRVNEVWWRQRGNEYEVWYTDGYKTQLLNWFGTRLEAIAAAATAMERGAGGGFTSHFRPAWEV